MDPNNERTLDEVTITFLADLAKESEDAQKKAAMKAAQDAAMPYVNQQQAALQLYIRREKLDGAWKLQPDGKTIVREG